MMKSELISLSNQPETLVEVDIRGLFLRSDVREKINTYFHGG
jgi:hypothetical protein